MSYEGVHAHPDGESTVARMALTASEYGYDGVVIRNHGDSPASYDPDRIRETYDVDVVTGVEVRASDPGRASGFVGSHRQDRTIVAVHGGERSMNRFAVEQPAVDVLAHPLAGDGDVDHVLARAAADNGVRIEITLRDVIRRSGGSRVRALEGLRRLWEILEYYDTPYVVSVDPRNHLEMRAPRDVQALGGLIGMDADDVADGLAEWGRLATRNRNRQSEAFVEPGVYRNPPPHETGADRGTDPSGSDHVDGNGE